MEWHDILKVFKRKEKQTNKQTNKKLEPSIFYLTGLVFRVGVIGFPHTRKN